MGEAAPPGTVSWDEVRREAIQRLTQRHVDSAAIEVRRMIEAASGCEPDEYAGMLDAPVTVRQMATFDRMIERRLHGEPVQYVIGSWSFRTLDLYVDRRVLIPRPETEVVAEYALHELDRLRQRASRSVAVDLGTGSGAIALSLAAERDELEIYACDVSADAIDVARANLAGLGRRARAVHLCCGSWFDPLPPGLLGAVDVIVANPPYIADHEQLDDEVRLWEPRQALIAGPTGLEALRTIVFEAGQWLQPRGALVLEIGATQGPAVVALASAAGFGDVSVAPDLARRDRVVIARR